MKITNRHAVFVFGPMDVNGRFEGSQCHVHIRWICGDAMFACAQNGETTLYTRVGRPTRPGPRFVARHAGDAEIHPAGSLQEVPRGSRHAPKPGAAPATIGFAR